MGSPSSFMAGADLLSLSPELIIIVMTQLSSPKDLESLLLTSQYMNKIFIAHKRTILQSVINNAIHQENMFDALAACRATSVLDIWVEQPEQEFPVRERTQFVETYTILKAEAAESVQPVHEPQTLASLCKLWWLVDRHVSGFLEQASDTIVREPLFKAYSVETISESEYMNLQRAFFRFEIWRKLFADLQEQTLPASDISREVLAPIQAFFELFPPWEREQLLSVHEYLARVAKAIVRDLQDYLIQQFRQVAESENLTIDNEPSRLRAGLESSLDLSGLDIFNKRKSYFAKGRFGYLAARGLPFLRWLQRLPLPDRFRVVENCSYQSYVVSLFESLKESESEYCEGGRQDWTAEFASSPPEAWGWTHREGESSGLEKHTTLRATGYIFWDSRRMHKDKARLASVDIEDEVCGYDRDLHGDWDDDTLTAEEVFKTLPLRKGIFFDIADAMSTNQELTDELCRQRLRRFMRSGSGHFGVTEY